jgi:hypothetical protein
MASLSRDSNWTDIPGVMHGSSRVGPHWDRRRHQPASARVERPGLHTAHRADSLAAYSIAIAAEYARALAPRLVRLPVSRAGLSLGGGTYLAEVRAGAVPVGNPRHRHDQEPHKDYRRPARFDLLQVPDIGYRYDDRFKPSPPSSWAATRGQLKFLATGFGSRGLRSGAMSATLTRHQPSGGIREQLDRLGQAEIMAGEEGSAFHILILLKDMRRRSSTSSGGTVMSTTNPHHWRCPLGHQSFYGLEPQRLLRAHWRVVSKISPNASEILDVPVPSVRDAATASVEPADRPRSRVA